MVRSRQEYRHEGASAAVAGTEPRADVREEERGLPGQRAEAGRYPGANQRAVAQAVGAAGYPVPRAARGRTSGAEAGGQAARQIPGRQFEEWFIGQQPAGRRVEQDVSLALWKSV